MQELIPVFKIGEDGVFQLEDLPDGVAKLFDKAYLFEDANFYTLDDYEKKETLKQYCRMLNSMGASFKIVIMNNNRDLEKMRRDLFLRCSDTRYADLVASINTQVEKSVSENGSIEQVRLFVITCRREDEELQLRKAQLEQKSGDVTDIEDLRALAEMINEPDADD